MHIRDGCVKFYLCSCGTGVFPFSFASRPVTAIEMVYASAAKRVICITTF